jgi:DNA-binding CsgD family transcriptional regulator
LKAVKGIECIIPWDTAVGLFAPTGDLLLGLGLSDKARDEYHSYYKFHIPFLPESHFPITSPEALVHDAVSWKVYDNSTFVADFAKPNGMAYTLTRFIPKANLVFSLHRSKTGLYFRELECLMLYIVNQHLGNLASFFERSVQLQGKLPSPEEIVDQFPSLSNREAEVLTLLNLGLTAPEIATKLFVSERTVESHVSHIYEKFNVRSKREAIDEIRHRKDFQKLYPSHYIFT